MRKGLKSTLLTVAVALLGYQAMANAPTISSIPDVIIGDAETGTSSNNFVFPQALNANTLASDDAPTTPGAIKWSFANPGGHYSINGRTSNDAVVGFNYEAPPTAYDLDVDSDPASTDTTARTWTFRNTFYSPIVGGNTNPGAVTGVAQDGQVITVFASDGTTHSSKTFSAYILNDGNDGLSGSVGTVEYDFTPSAAGANGWTSVNLGVAGSCTVVPGTANGLCLSGAAGGDNVAQWRSELTYPDDAGSVPYTTVNLSNNAVYRVRYTVQASGSEGGLVPFWTTTYDNSLLAYGSTSFFLDTGSNSIGGANAMAPYGPRTTFDMWAANPALKVAALSTELFTVPDSMQYKNFRLQFRLLDLATKDGGVSGYGGEYDFGTICMQNVTVTKYDFDAASVGTPTAISLVSPTVTVNDYSIPAGSTTAVLAGGALTLTPASSGSWSGTNEPYVHLDCGDTTLLTPVLANNYPIPWVAEQLYQLKYTLATPATGANPPDFVFFGATSPTFDLITETFVTNKFAGKAFPTSTSCPQNYYAFFYSHGAPLAGGDYARWAPYFAVGCLSTFTDTANSDGIILQSMTVTPVSY